jgi:ABC-2 type transport system ATP-binding protein
MTTGRLKALFAAAVVAALVASVVPATVEARDFVMPSFDGTPIVGHFLPAAGLKPGERAPVVLKGPGWGSAGESDENAGSDPAGTIGVGPLRAGGYNVITWDPRGFGGSGDVAHVDGPDFEARDVQALLDLAAGQPEVQLDGPRDPRAGMVGGSYGGGIQLVTAAIEPRLDAIVPDIAWNSLVSSLYKANAFKTGWGAALYGAGLATGVAAGAFSPAGTQTGSYDPHIHQAYVEGNTTGVLSKDSFDWFASRGPAAAVGRITIPTFLTQGTPDTLFTLHEAIVNYGILRAAGVPVKLLWHCGGHGVCLTDAGTDGADADRIERATLKWFARYLRRDPSVATGPAFEWVTQDGAWHTASDYPLPAGKPVVAKGAGSLLLHPTHGSGAAILASSSVEGLNIDIPAPVGGVRDLAGEPKLTFSYKGTAGPAAAFAYAQIVDLGSNVVAGNQATPIPLTLDGQPHTAAVTLEGIALTMAPSDRLQLQIVPATSLYREQTASGMVDVTDVVLEMPSVDLAASAAAPAPQVVARRRASVSLTPLSTRRSRRFRVRVVARGEALRRVTLDLRDARGRRLARAVMNGVATGSRGRIVTLRLRRVPRAGAVRLTARYRTASGAARLVTRTARLR